MVSAAAARVCFRRKMRLQQAAEEVFRCGSKLAADEVVNGWTAVANAWTAVEELRFSAAWIA